MSYSKPTNQLSISELHALDNELEKYRVERYNKHFEEIVSLIDVTAWLKAKGALNVNGAVVIQDYKPATYTNDGKLIEPKECAPILYERCMHEYDQWLAWKGKKEYAEKQHLNGLDAMAVDNSLA